MRVYFDHNATTPVDPVVAEAVVRALTAEFGNASSVHHFGQQAKGVLDDARTAVAKLIGGEPSGSDDVQGTGAARMEHYPAAGRDVWCRFAGGVEGCAHGQDRSCERHARQ